MNRPPAEMGDATAAAPAGQRGTPLSDGAVRVLRSGTVALILVLYVGGLTL